MFLKCEILGVVGVTITILTIETVSMTQKCIPPHQKHIPILRKVFLTISKGPVEILELSSATFLRIPLYRINPLNNTAI